MLRTRRNDAEDHRRALRRVLTPAAFLVPEPTTGLQLVLGLAMLAARRSRDGRA